MHVLFTYYNCLLILYMLCHALLLLLYHFRRAALQQWKQKLGSGATYNKLISVFERAGYKNYADEVRKIVSDDNSDSDSSGNEDSALALPQPPTFPHLSLPSPIQLPPDLPEHSSHETFYLIDSAISNNFLEEGKYHPQVNTGWCSLHSLTLCAQY